jgi:hypothetical protein
VVGNAFPTRGGQVARSQIRWFAIGLACLLAGFVLAVVLSHAGIRLGGVAGTTSVHT